MNKNLDRIELHLRMLFEEKLIRIFTGKQHQSTLIEDLIQSMRDNLKIHQEGRLYAPDYFIFYVPQEDYLEWQSHHDLLDQLAATLHTTGQNEGFLFNKSPTISLLVDPMLPQHNYHIEATISNPAPVLTDTAAMTPVESMEPQSILPKEAFFVVGGISNFPLNKPVINIGRHSDCDLILDNPHVSRHHAQLRAINQQYVIFDVGSTGGVYLNGKKISQATLQAGDVIRLGVVNLIYIQETTMENPTTVIPTADEDSENLAGNTDKDLSGDH